jgi:hypothetical protein
MSGLRPTHQRGSGAGCCSVGRATRGDAVRGAPRQVPVSLATVCNTLNQLTDAGLLRQVSVAAQDLFRHQRDRASPLLSRTPRTVEHSGSHLVLKMPALRRLRSPGSTEVGYAQALGSRVAAVAAGLTPMSIIRCVFKRMVRG